MNNDTTWKHIDTSTEEGLRKLDRVIASRLGVSFYYDEKDKDWWERISCGQARRLTRYSTNLNSAATLPVDETCHWEIQVYYNSATHAAIVKNGFEGEVTRYADASEAVARCKAWLATK